MEKPNTSNTSNFSEEQLARYKKYGIMSMQCSAIFRQKLGNLLKAEREKRGLSLEELSQEIYISLPKLQNIEEGKKQKSWCIISVLLKFYNKELKISLADKTSPCE